MFIFFCLETKENEPKEKFKAVKKKIKNDCERLKSANSHLVPSPELWTLFRTFCRYTGLGSSTRSDIRTFLRLSPAFFLTFFLQGHMLRRLLSALIFDCNKWLNLQKYKKNGCYLILLILRTIALGSKKASAVWIAVSETPHKP